ncbi:MAG: hypothetical protein IJL47_03580 [Lachnospiraceae bacterium]|nr:hypothetical protein [Lachnospiraceae bacterium]
MRSKTISRLLEVKLVSDKRRFYLLSLSWGLLMNLAGGIAAAAMLLTGHKMRRFGPCFYFEHGKDWGGMDWGMFIVVCKGADQRLLAHELGHAMQNCRFGPFMPLLVGLPSSLRYHFRKLHKKVTGKEPKPPYDSIWFEAQATQLGQEYLKLSGQ